MPRAGSRSRLSLALAVAVSFGIRFLVNLCSFWLLDYRGPVMIAIAVNLVLSGAVIPLTFFPEPLDTILRLTPFAAMLQAPVDIYVGQPVGGSAAFALALQLFWAVALYVRRAAHARRRHAKAGAAGWLSWAASTCGSWARECVRSSSTGSPPCSSSSAPRC